MSRNGSITYQISKELLSKCKFGESRNDYKIKGTANKYIFSFNTLKTYQKQIGYMVKWAKQNDIKLKNLDDIKEHADEWLQYCIDENMSAWTLSTRRSALFKLLDVPYSYFKVELPSRNRGDIKRGRNKDAVRHFSESNNFQQVTFCKCTGLRLSELKRIKGNCLFYKVKVPYLRVTEGTKGGKKRDVVLCGSADEIALCVELCKKVGNEKVFKNVKENANTHGYRAIYAQRIYDKFARPIPEIKDRREKMFCRNDKAGIIYDNRALFIASRNLGHNRIEVVARNYLY